MKSRIQIPVLSVILFTMIGCATARHYGSFDEHGSSTFVVDCSAHFLNDFEDCYKNAADLCPKGYFTAASTTTPGSVGFLSHLPSVRTLTIKCK